MTSSQLPVLGKAFKPPEEFQRRAGTRYWLLPFRFLRLDAGRYIATNFAGEYVVLGGSELHALVRHELDIHGSVYRELKSKHFIFDSDSTTAIDLLSCQYRTKQSLLAELTSLFLFVVTLRCEHSCPYCQVSRRSQDKHAFDMQPEHAQKALDVVFASPAMHLKLEFQGGEPLLNFELVRSIVVQASARAAATGRSVQFVIASNLALLTDEILDFCYEHEVLISTSLDGPRELHNTNRPRPGGDSYERTVVGIERARERLGNERVSALMTTTQASLSQPEAIIDEYVRRGFSSIFLRALSPYGFAVKTGAAASYSTTDWLAFYKRGLDYIIRLNADQPVLREEYAALLVRKIVTPFPTSYVDLQSPAGVGISCLAFNYNGDIFASDEARMLAEMGDMTFRVGHLSTSTFEDVLGSDRLFGWLADTMTEGVPMCSDCGIQPYCGSDPVFHHAVQGDVVGRKPLSSFCQKNMSIIRYLIRLLEDDPIAGDVLRSWM